MANIDDWEHDFNAWLTGLVVPPYGLDAERKCEEAMMRLAYRAGWAVGYFKASESAKEDYRDIHSGGCRILSEGSDCRCFLCRVDYRRAEAAGDWL